MIRPYNDRFAMLRRPVPTRQVSIRYRPSRRKGQCRHAHLLRESDKTARRNDGEGGTDP